MTVSEAITGGVAAIGGIPIADIGGLLLLGFFVAAIWLWVRGY